MLNRLFNMIINNGQPNYKREAPQCSNCKHVIMNYHFGFHEDEYRCNINPKHPKLIDDCGICDNHKREM